MTRQHIATKRGYECWIERVPNGANPPYLELYLSEDDSDWIADKDNVGEALGFFKEWVDGID